MKEFVQTSSSVFEELDEWRQITEEEVEAAAEMVRRNEISGGTPVVRRFEEEWRRWIGSDFCLTTFNGTTAIYSALFGLGVGPGDEIIVPVNTWIGSVSGALCLGARPVFCEIDPNTLLLDPKDIGHRITEHTRCIMPVHLWGNVCDMDAILAIAQKHGIPVLEDCSHAHGARYKGRMCGSIGDIACWSLQGSKAVSAGEGGVITTSNTDAYERACLIGQVNRIAGVDLVSGNYDQFQPLGFGMKFRAHPIGIAIAAIQWRRLNKLNEGRRRYFEAVEAGLAELPGVRAVYQYDGVERGGYYGMPILHDPVATPGLSTADVVTRLRKIGVVAEVTPYPNLHELPLFAQGFDLYTRGRGPLAREQGYRGYKPGDFPQAEYARENTIFIPRVTYPKPDAAQRVLEALHAVVAGQLTGASAR